MKQYKPAKLKHS